MAAQFDRAPTGDNAALEALQRRTLEILRADQVLAEGKVRFYQEGTAILLMEKEVAGTTCADNVSLVQS